ncbi:Methyladenine glycosylase, partial [Dillenia turbinata]
TLFILLSMMKNGECQSTMTESCLSSLFCHKHWRNSPGRLFDLNQHHVYFLIFLQAHFLMLINRIKSFCGKLFDNFDPASVDNFNETKFSSVNANGNALLSEPNNYCWSFVNNQPIKNRFRYARHVPPKTPKAELISKDLTRRGFRFVGPTVLLYIHSCKQLVSSMSIF